MIIALNLLYDQIYIRPCWAHILPLCHLLISFCGMNPIVKGITKHHQQVIHFVTICLLSPNGLWFTWKSPLLKGNINLHFKLCQFRSFLGYNDLWLCVRFETHSAIWGSVVLTSCEPLFEYISYYLVYKYRLLMYILYVGIPPKRERWRVLTKM